MNRKPLEGRLFSSDDDEPTDDDCPYCTCTDEHTEEEFAANACDCCGKVIEI